MIQFGKIWGKAGHFGVILKAKRVTSSLMERVMGECDVFGVQGISWGIANEAEAVEAFEITKMAVRETGLWLHRSGVLGTSSDGLLGNNALLEAKCLSRERNLCR